MIRPWWRVVWLVCLGAVLSACVSSQSAPANRDAAKLRVALAEQYYQAKNLDEAKRQLDLALASDKQYAPAYTMMALLLQAEGSPTNAQLADTYFKKALELDRQYAAGYFYYGLYLVEQDKPEQAAAYFEQAGGQLGYQNRLAALENLAYLRHQAWQKQPTLAKWQLAHDALSRAVAAGSRNEQLLLALQAMAAH